MKNSEPAYESLYLSQSNNKTEGTRKDTQLLHIPLASNFSQYTFKNTYFYGQNSKLCIGFQRLKILVQNHEFRVLKSDPLIPTSLGRKTMVIGSMIVNT
jgi:hypothetical protein